jgi:hypothetical protein
MGTLAPDPAGAGSAVNGTVSQVGGTLRLAVVGSVMSTFYRPHVVDAPLSPDVLHATADTADEPVVAWMGVANVAAQRGGWLGRDRSWRRVHGRPGGWDVHVAAAGWALAAIAAVSFLPARTATAPQGPTRRTRQASVAPPRAV